MNTQPTEIVGRLVVRYTDGGSRPIQWVSLSDYEHLKTRLAGYKEHELTGAQLSTSIGASGLTDQQLRGEGFDIDAFQTYTQMRWVGTIAGYVLVQGDPPVIRRGRKYELPLAGVADFELVGQFTATKL